jgi:hypothetical protein
MRTIRKIIHLDAMIEICGHFYIDRENWCNNGYNCSHKDCEDQVLFDKNGNEVDLDKLLWRYYQGFNLKKKRLLKKKRKEYLQKRNDTEYWVQRFDLKSVGRCFSFSCPLAHRADLEDMQEIDKELAIEFEDDMAAMAADYMVVDGVLANKC